MPEKIMVFKLCLFLWSTVMQNIQMDWREFSFVCYYLFPKMNWNIAYHLQRCLDDQLQTLA